MIDISSIVYRTDKKTGYVYAYESFSYRDSVTKRPRSKQVYLGRVDVVTKEILPKGQNGKRNRSKSSAKVDELQNQVAANQQKIKEAKETINILQQRLGKADRFFDDLRNMVSHYEEIRTSNPTESSSLGGDV